jgi:hypothetical protein
MNKKFFTPTHHNTNSAHNYHNLNQVQRELDFGGTKSKFGQPYAGGSVMFSPHGQQAMNYQQPVTTPQNSSGKALSFVNTIKSPTAIRYSNADNKVKVLTNTDSKFSVNNTEKEVLDHKINLENILISKDKRTTVMLRNIPNKYTLQNLVDEIVNHNPSFGGKFDYINLPIDYEVQFFIKI